MLILSFLYAWFFMLLLGAAHAQTTGVPALGYLTVLDLTLIVVILKGLLSSDVQVGKAGK